MANEKISAMPAAAAWGGTDLLAMVQGGVNVAGTPAQVKTFVLGNVTLTNPATAATLTIANNKTLTVSNTLTLAGTDGQTMTFPTTSATIARTDAAQTFTGVQTFGTPIAVGSGGSGVANTGNLTWNAAQTFSFTSAQTMTFPAATDTLAGLATAQTFTGLNTFAPTAVASPTALTWSAQSVVAGTSNTAGVNWTFAGSQGTGTGAGGSLLFQTAPAGTTGTSKNALSTALTIVSAGQLQAKVQSAAAPAYSFAGATDVGMDCISATLNFYLGGTQQLAIANGTIFLPASSALSWSNNTFLTAGNAKLQLGAANAASPVAQTLSTQGSRGGTDTNVAGGNLTIVSGLGTGNATVATTTIQAPVVQASGTTQQTAAAAITVKNSTATGLQFNGYGAGAITSDASGNLTASSDERLKDVQGFYTGGLAELRQINPISYRWNADSGMETEHAYVGFSAQNVRDSLPEAVGLTPDGMLTLQDRALLATLVNAVKELAAR